MLHALYYILSTKEEIKEVYIYDSVSKKIKGASSSACIKYIQNVGEISNVKVIDGKLRPCDGTSFRKYDCSKSKIVGLTGQMYKTLDNIYRYDKVIGVGFNKQYTWLIGLCYKHNIAKLVDANGKELVVHATDLRWLTIQNCVIDIDPVILIPAFGIEEFDVKVNEDVELANINFNLLGLDYNISTIGNILLIKDASKMTELIVPRITKSIQHIGNDKFSSLKKLVIPNTIEQFRENQFGRCKSLTELKMEDGMTAKELKKYFIWCPSLKVLKIPEGIEKVCSNCFYNLEGCRNIELPSTIKHLAQNAFEWLSDIDITVPIGCEKIHRETFSVVKNCTLRIPLKLKEQFNEDIERSEKYNIKVTYY